MKEFTLKIKSRIRATLKITFNMDKVSSIVIFMSLKEFLSKEKNKKGP